MLPKFVSVLSMAPSDPWPPGPPLPPAPSMAAAFPPTEPVPAVALATPPGACQRPVGRRSPRIVRVTGPGSPPRSRTTNERIQDRARRDRLPRRSRGRTVSGTNPRGGGVMERAGCPREAPDPGLAARTVNLVVVPAASTSPGIPTARVGTGKTDSGQRQRRGWVFTALACCVVLVAIAGGLVLGLGLTTAGATPAPPASPAPATPVAASPAPDTLSPASPAPPIVPRAGSASTARRTPGSSTRVRSSTSPRHAPSRPAQRTRSTSDG